MFGKRPIFFRGAPVWTAAGSGIPDVPTNAFAIDPQNTQNVFAGTDIGVFRSQNGGTTWTPFSDGLPRVAVFGMEFHQSKRVLRIATHGRGMYRIRLCLRPTPFDFDADVRADLSVFRPTDNRWYVLRGTAGFMIMEFGNAGDMITPADYDGDGKTDISVFRPSTGQWFIFNSATSTFQTVSWGANGDMPVPADHDGDGKADLVVFRQSTGQWFSKFSASGNFSTVNFGVAGDKPVVGDFDGDGKSDIALYRPSDNNWYILKTGFGSLSKPGAKRATFPCRPITTATERRMWPYSGPRPGNGSGYAVRQASIRSVGEQTAISLSRRITTATEKPMSPCSGPSIGTWFVVGSTSGQLIQAVRRAGDQPTQGAFIY